MVINSAAFRQGSVLLCEWTCVCDGRERERKRPVGCVV